MKEYLCAYEQYMESQLNRGWLNSEQLSELFAMSHNQENIDRSRLKYMSLREHGSAKTDKVALDCYSKLEGIMPVRSNSACPSALTETKHAAQAAVKPNDVFEQHRQQLIKEIKEKREKLASKERQELEAEEQRKIEAENERLQKEKEADEKRKEETRKAAEIIGGINLNGVTSNKPIESLLRTLKRWTESLIGQISEPEIEQIKSRFTHVYHSVRPRDKQTWLKQIEK